MARIIRGRYTAERNDPFVVFLIGIRVNSFWAIHKWYPTFKAMRPMLTTLFKNPEKGLLGTHTWFSWRELMLVQYWRSFDDLERFARDSSDPHLSAWKRFNQMVGSDGSVGIWHETYLVQAKQYECVYGNMPIFGLARATRHVPAIGDLETARLRLGGYSKPAIPSPEIPRD
ncbi:MAG: DUF4188 domain-containing protein [Gammaproteobacteria bacterium]|nr:DUF4188 domain-containing protein [Gammaproteobacteria bacterium]MCI0591785.1 DUF4188 domain-containing protein [Gammaproteobacteria bacterium]